VGLGTGVEVEAVFAPDAVQVVATWGLE